MPQLPHRYTDRQREQVMESARELVRYAAEAQSDLRAELSQHRPRIQALRDDMADLERKIAGTRADDGAGHQG